MREENLLKKCIKTSKKLSFSLGLLVTFLINGTIGYANGGISLNDSAVSIGKGSLSTGKSTIAVGENSFASGDNITREEYAKLIKENKDKLAEIQKVMIEKQNKEEDLEKVKAEHNDIVKKIENLEGLKNNLIDKENTFANIKPEILKEIEMKKIEAINYNEQIQKIKEKLKMLDGINIDDYAGDTFDEKIENIAQEIKPKLEQGMDFLGEEGISKEEIKDGLYSVIVDLKLNQYMKTYNDLYNVSNLEDFSSIDKNLYLLTEGYNEYLKKDIRRLSDLDGRPLSIEEKIQKVFAPEKSEEYLAKFYEVSDIVTQKEKEIAAYKEKGDDLSLYKLKQAEKELNEEIKKYPMFSGYTEFDFKINPEYFMDNDFEKLKDLNISSSRDTFLQLYINQDDKEDIIKLLNILKNKEQYFQPFHDEIIRLEGLEKEAEEYISIRMNKIAGYEADIKNLNTLIANSNPGDIESINKQIKDKENAIQLAEKEIADMKADLNIVSSGENAIASGKNAVATGENAVAMGFNTFTSGENSIAFGTNTTVVGENSIAFGTGHKIVGVGTSTIGDPNNIYGNNNHVYGNNNNIGMPETPNHNNFILGSNIISTVDNAIVLGNNSTAVENALSIGSENNLRKIVNVAPGEISENSHDVVNGSQLYSLAKANSEDIDINSWKEKLGIKKNNENINNLNYYNKKETDSKLNEKVNVTELAKYTKLDGSNLESLNKANWTGALKKDIETATSDDEGFATSKGVKDYVEGQGYAKTNDISANYYNKKETDSKLNEKADKSNTYTKKEVDTKIQNVTSKAANIDGEVTEGETRGVTGDKVAKSINKTNRVVKQVANQVITNTENIDYVYRQSQANRQAIKSINKRIDKLDGKINKVSALSQATANLDFGNVRVGNVAVGAGVATYMGNQAVAVGVAYRPNEDWFMAAKWSGVAGDPHYNSIGGSVSYQFNLK